MYKIYIDQTPLYLRGADASEILTTGTASDLVLRYSGKSKQLLQVIDMLQKSSKFDSVTLWHTDVAILFKDLESLVKRIEAAGGVVFDENHEVLLIFRRGFWDLPKGKADPGETLDQTALREVEEETGLQNLNLEREIGETWHIYVEKGKKILKRTTWFGISTSKQELKLQHEEDIDMAKWVRIDEFLATESQVYGNIRDILTAAKD